MPRRRRVRNVSTLQPFTIRLHPAEVHALDSLVDREGGSRSKHVGRAIALLLSLEAQREQVARVVRDEAQKALQLIVAASQASDEKSRQLVLDFLDALSAPAPSGNAAPGELPPPRR